MITQNPFIGRSRKRLGNCYMVTFLGQNVMRTCPVRWGHKKTSFEKNNLNTFGILQAISVFFLPSFLTMLYYQQPQGRTRRNQLMSDLLTMRHLVFGTYIVDGSHLQQLGTNAIGSHHAASALIESTEIHLPIFDFDFTNDAELSTPFFIFAVSNEARDSFIAHNCYKNAYNEIVVSGISGRHFGKEFYFYALPYYKNLDGTANYSILCSYSKEE